VWKKNGDVNVVEEFVYDFGDDKRHGIFRDIPLFYNRNGNQYNSHLTDVKVTDNNGQAMIFTTSFQDRNLHIIIGDQNKTITGGKVYKIYYKIKRAFNFLDRQSEFFWNVTGNKWSLPITQAVYTITLPELADKINFQSECLSGAIGAMKECLSTRYQFDSQDKISGAVFVAENIPAGGSMTAVIKVPDGFIKRPSFGENILFFIQENFWLFCLFLAAILIFIVWRFRRPRT